MPAYRCSAWLAGMMLRGPLDRSFEVDVQAVPGPQVPHEVFVDGAVAFSSFMEMRYGAVGIAL
eukprot:5657912-Alexandrium_andersonii.AAC.1